MRAKTVGRALGIGMRVAGSKLLASAPSPEPNAAPSPDGRGAASQRSAVETGRTAGVRSRQAAADLTRGTKNVGRGAKHFGRAVWNPFAHASGVLWLEITGMFFGLFGVFFAQHLYTLRGAYRGGPEHTHFLVYALFSVVFLYFSGSSFLRARRKQARR